MIKLIIYFGLALQLSLLCAQPMIKTRTVELQTSKQQYNGDIIYPNYIPSKFY